MSEIPRTSYRRRKILCLLTATLGSYNWKIEIFYPKCFWNSKCLTGIVVSSSCPLWVEMIIGISFEFRVLRRRRHLTPRTAPDSSIFSVTIKHSLHSNFWHRLKTSLLTFFHIVHLTSPKWTIRGCFDLVKSHVTHIPTQISQKPLWDFNFFFRCYTFVFWN